MHSFEVKRLRAKAIFKIIFTGLLFSLVPLFTLFGALASAEIMNLYWNGEPLTGLNALLAGPFIGLLITIVFGLFVSIFVSLGLMLLSKKKSVFLVEYYPVESERSS